jgi:hypothetical protein
VPDVRALSLADFDRYIEEHGIPEEHWPAAFALWIAEVTGGPVLGVQEGRRVAAGTRLLSVSVNPAPAPRHLEGTHSRSGRLDGQSGHVRGNGPSLDLRPDECKCCS